MSERPGASAEGAQPERRSGEHCSAVQRREDLIALMREMQSKHECPLVATRTKLVFGAGNADADLLFVGEAPGFYEDQQGLPFVGRAGKLLDQLLVEIGLERKDAFITNVLKCRPPDNRDPSPDEIEVCKPYLFRQIELIEPKVVCTLGNFSLKLLTRSSTGITRVHGQPQEHGLGGRTVQLYPLYHPAAALRGTNVLDQLREDFHRLPGLIAAQRPPEPEPQPDPASQMDLFG